MIIVAGGASVAGLAGRLPRAQRDILERKQRSPRLYRYASLPALEFELNARANTVEAARAMAMGQAGFASFATSRCNEQFWQRTDEGGFRLKRGVRPSAAVNDIYANSGLYAFECAAAAVIVLYKAMLDTIGPAKFDAMFANLYIYSWNYDRDLRLIQHTSGEQFPGDVRYIRNPDVDPATPQWQGENAFVMMEPDTYFGHGIGITSSNQMIAVLNRHRRPGATRSAHMLDEITHPDYAALHAAANSAMPRTDVLPFGNLAVRIGHITHVR